MKINIIKEKKWFSAHVENTGIFTQWDNFEELIKNLNEAISLYQEEDIKNISSVKLDKFSLTV